MGAAPTGIDEDAANRAATAEEVGSLLEGLAAARGHAGRSFRVAASLSGLGRSTLERLEHGHGERAALDVLARAGLAAGVRLELHVAGVGEHLVRRAPATSDGRDWTGGADLAGDGAWLVRLAGEEVRRLRRLQGRHARDLVSDGAVGSPETLWRWEKGAAPQLRHAVAVALCLGARWVWQPLEADWRVRLSDKAACSPGSTEAQLALAARQGRRAALLTSVAQDWRSPPDLVAALQAEHGAFALDAAATEPTSVGADYLGPDHRIWARRDAIATQVAEWTALCNGPGAVFLNPPFATSQGSGLDPWLRRAVATAGRGRPVVALLPARTDTQAWHEHVVDGGGDVQFLRGRLRYGRPGDPGPGRPAPFASAIVAWHAVS